MRNSLFEDEMGGTAFPPASPETMWKNAYSPPPTVKNGNLDHPMQAELSLDDIMREESRQRGGSTRSSDRTRREIGSWKRNAISEFGISERESRKISFKKKRPSIGRVTTRRVCHTDDSDNEPSVSLPRRVPPQEGDPYSQRAYSERAPNVFLTITNATFMGGPTSLPQMMQHEGFRLPYSQPERAYCVANETPSASKSAFRIPRTEPRVAVVSDSSDVEITRTVRTTKRKKGLKPGETIVLDDDD